MGGRFVTMLPLMPEACGLDAFPPTAGARELGFGAPLDSAKAEPQTSAETAATGMMNRFISTPSEFRIFIPIADVALRDDLEERCEIVRHEVDVG
jgi:hypothetical protein